jgi:hypothetical protein
MEPFREVWSTAGTPVPTPVLIAVTLVAAYLIVVGLVGSRKTPNFGPVVAFLALFFAYRVYFLPLIFYGDWYMPPFLALVMIVAALGMQRLASVTPRAPAVLATVLAVAYAIHMPFSFVVESKVQAIENNVRTQTGEYLRANVQPGQSVVSESAGYIGFYGNVKLYDYPGLTSPTSVRALRTLPLAKRDIADLIDVLQPDWLVLRPWELDALRSEFPDVAAKYAVDRVVEMPGVPESQLNVNGAASVSFGGLVETSTDEKFTVLKRVS